MSTIIKMESSLQLCPGISLFQRTRTICQYATLMKSNGIVYKKISLTIVKVVWLSWLHAQTHCVNNIVCTRLFDGTVCNTSSSGISNQETRRILIKLYSQVSLASEFSWETAKKKLMGQIHWFYITVLNSKYKIYNT